MCRILNIKEIALFKHLGNNVNPVKKFSKCQSVFLSCLSGCMHAGMDVWMYLCMYTCMDAYTYVCMYVCMFVSMSVCLSVCMYVCYIIMYVTSASKLCYNQVNAYHKKTLF